MTRPSLGLKRNLRAACGEGTIPGNAEAETGEVVATGVQGDEEGGWQSGGEVV